MPTATKPRLDPVRMKPGLQRLLITDEVRDHSATGSLLKRADNLGLEQIETWDASENASINAKFREEKRTVKLRLNRGSFIKPWESPECLVGRDEWCLTPVEGCPLDCDYCYLQDYLDRPLIQLFVNQEQITDHVRGFCEDPPEDPTHFFSLGELSDGLFLEPLTHTVRKVWDVFRDMPAKLEVRSKSHHVHGLTDELEPHPDGVFSWTLSPPEVAQRNEMITSSLDQRLAAMKQMLDAGFRVAARLDPVVLRDGWEELYRDLVHRLEQALALEDLTFILIGTFRFPRGFDRTIRERFPNRSFHRDEFVEAPDGKLRYPRPRRVDAYQKLIDWLRQAGTEPGLCMEPEYIWEDAGLR